MEDLNGNGTPEAQETSNYTPVRTALSDLPHAASMSDNGTLVAQKPRVRPLMKTGCIPCLVRGIACDPQNPSCKTSMSAEWHIDDGASDSQSVSACLLTPAASESLTVFRPDTKWRRSWRDRTALHFFVNFTAPQMSGFFDNTFWSRMVVQASYNEPAILHAMIAIGSLHQSVMQGVYTDERRKAQAVEFALLQCNRSISCLTGSVEKVARPAPSAKLALTTAVLFTAFESMQGHAGGAVNHALQAKKLMQALSNHIAGEPVAIDDDEIEEMRMTVERLDVQATAWKGKSYRPESDNTGLVPILPVVSVIYSLEHAHRTLHTAMNSIMRFLQCFHPTAAPDHTSLSMAEKSLRYVPWFTSWEVAFSTWLMENRRHMANMDLKRAMVLKTNHIVATLLATADQSLGPVAYQQFDEEFRAIVNLSREVLAAFSCPPLPTLSPGDGGKTYLSFSLWVTDPLWMVVSRCHNDAIVQAALTLLSQNPQQQGLWHEGPQATVATLQTSSTHSFASAASSSSSKSSTPKTETTQATTTDSRPDADDGRAAPSVPEHISHAEEIGNMAERTQWMREKVAREQMVKEQIQVRPKPDRKSVV